MSLPKKDPVQACLHRVCICSGLAEFGVDDSLELGDFVGDDG
jgi:hypothetical protein